MSTIFDRYSLINHLARKDKHDVYLAYHLDTPEQRVVLKVFDIECLMPEATPHYFKHTAETLRQLTHPFILPFYALGVAHRKPYIATGYVSGESLRIYLDRSKRLPLNDALGIVRQVGEAIVFAHSQQIIHQDIRPENIFFDAMGNALLTDFLLPHLIHEDHSSNDAAYSGYKAPEQVSGVIHPSADQYALGCLLYELTTGSLPFANRENARFMVPIAPTKLVPDLPRAIEAVMLRALAVRPEERYDSVTVFLNELKETQQPEPPLFPFAHLTAPHASHPSKVVREKAVVPPVHLKHEQEEVIPPLVAMDQPVDASPADMFTASTRQEAEAHTQTAGDPSGYEKDQNESDETLNTLLATDSDVYNQTTTTFDLPEDSQINTIRVASPMKGTPEQVPTALASSVASVGKRNQHLTNNVTNSTRPTRNRSRKRQSLILLGIAAMFVIISTLLAPMTDANLAQALKNTPASVASPASVQPSPTVTFTQPRPNPDATKQAPTKPSKSPSVTPKATPTKSTAPKTQPTAVVTVPKTQPTTVPAKLPTPTPTTAPPTPTPVPASLCAGVAAWSSGVAYVGGNKVTYNGSLWQAKWWTENDVPGGSANVWTSAGTC